jgi:hypothetical protein
MCEQCNKINRVGNVNHLKAMVAAIEKKKKFPDASMETMFPGMPTNDCIILLWFERILFDLSQQ